MSITYNYIFQSPIKYEIKSDNDYYQCEYKHISQLITQEQISNIINNYTKNFKEYLNHDGLLEVKFTVAKGNILNINVQFDHPLIKKEFNSLYTDLQAQLIDGIGKQISNICIKEFVDKNNNIQNNKKELETIKKQIYCLLWQEKDWRLIFITNHFYDQQTHKW